MRASTIVLLITLILMAPGFRLSVAADGGVDASTRGDGADAGVDGGGGPRLTRAPTVSLQPRPTYPPAALATRSWADVEMEVHLDEQGRVSDARVLRPVGEGFDEAALTAVKQMLFTPAEIDGRPAPLRIRYVMRFRPPAVVADGGLVDVGTEAKAADTRGDGDVVDVRGLGDAAKLEGVVDAGAPTAAGAALTVQGLVRERGTREPLVGAEVLVTALGRNGAPAGAGEVRAETDVQGRYQLRLPAAPGGLRVTISDSGHEPCVRDLPADAWPAAGASEPPPIEWSCLTSARSGPVYESVVAAERARPEEPRHELRRDEARSVPGTMGDPVRAVQSLPGVARPPYGLGLLIVRGASPWDSGAFLDGLEIPALYHFLVGPSVLTAELIESIDFYPGGFGVKYGRLSAGAIDVRTRANDSPRLRGSVEVSPLDASLFLEGPAGKRTSLTLALRRSTIDLVLPSLVPEKPGSSFATAVPAYWDYQLRFNHTLDGGGRVSLFLFGSDDQLDVVSADPNRRLELNNHIGFHRVSLRYTERLGPWTSELQPAYGYGDVSFAASSDGGYIRYHRLYLRETLTRELGTAGSLGLGLDGLFSYDWGHFDIQLPREGRTFGAGKPERIRIERAYVDVVPALWAELRLSLTERLRLSPGIRFDPYFIVDMVRMSLDPRLSLHYKASDKVGLRGGAGIYHQLPNPRYLDAEYGNDDLSLIRAEQYQVGADWQLSSEVRLSATLFALWRRHMPVMSPERFSSTGRSRARGLELLLRHGLGRHFYGWLAYTLSRAEQSADFADEVENGLASPRGVGLGELAQARWRPSTFDQTHNLVAVGSYRRASWELGARFRLVSGRPSTPISGSFADLDFAAHSPQRGAPYSERHPAFNQLDLRAERTFTFDLYRLGIFLDVQNVLNAENPEDVLYDYRYRESAPVRGLPILPFLGLRGSF